MKKVKEVKSVYKNDVLNAIVYSIDVSKIVPNSAQPRTDFDITAITKLADSIRRYGLLQPLSVRKAGEAGDKYELVAGERRLRACKMLQMQSVPCIIVAATDETAAELALVENLLRENLNMFEQAKAFSVLSTQYRLTQEEIAAKMSLSQSAVANKLRLLRLTPEEQNAIIASSLTERHARALLRIILPSRRKEALEYIICNKLNVAESEKYVTELLSSGVSKKAPKREAAVYSSEKICSSIYKFISKIQKSCDKNLIVNRKSDDKNVIITLTVKKTSVPDVFRASST